MKSSKSKRKTPVIKHSRNAYWDYKTDYELDYEDLPEHGIEFTVRSLGFMSTRIGSRLVSLYANLRTSPKLPISLLLFFNFCIKVVHHKSTNVREFDFFKTPVTGAEGTLPISGDLWSFYCFFWENWSWTFNILYLVGSRPPFWKYFLLFSRVLLLKVAREWLEFLRIWTIEKSLDVIRQFYDMNLRGFYLNTLLRVKIAYF